MPRFFIAIDLSAGARDRLAAICHGLPGTRWTPPEQLHLTLRFLGEMDGLEFSSVAGRLADIHLATFDLELRGLGVFPPRGLPRVLWAGVAATQPLLRLQKKVEVTVQQAGLPPEGRKFHPHVTLARLQNTPTGRLANHLAANGLFSLPPLPVTGFHLYESRLYPSGAVHIQRASYPLSNFGDTILNSPS